MTNIYEQLKQAGVQIESHESDLYCPVNETTKAIVNQYEHKANVTKFTDAISKTTWYDIPFAYAPWWEKRQSK